MTDQPIQAQPDKPNTKFNPVLLVFLIFPVMGIVMAIIIGMQHPASAPQQITSPPVTYTQFSLINSPAPDFTLATPNGQTIQLSSLRGQWVFLNFWATWCVPCRLEMPALQQLVNGDLGMKGKVTVLAVDKEEDASTIKAFQTELKLTIPVVMDTDNKVNVNYGIIGLPTTYIIDPQGIVRYHKLGPLSSDEITAYLADFNQPAANKTDGSDISAMR